MRAARVARAAGAIAAPLTRVSPRVQATALLGRREDPLEREADRFADAVMAGVARAPVMTTGTPAIQRAPAPGAGTPSAGAARAVRAVASGGAALPHDVRTWFEPRVGRALDDVRIHTDAAAARAAAAINARAFAWRGHIAFSAGEWRLSTAGGRRLIAHELAHVLQQTPDSEVVRRDPAPAAAPPRFDRRNPALFAELLAALDAIPAQTTSGEHELSVGGREMILESGQIEQLRASALAQLLSFARVIETRMNGARVVYNARRRINQDGMVNRVVSTDIAWLGGIDDPGAGLAVREGIGRGDLATARAAAATGRLALAFKSLRSAEAASLDMQRSAGAYESAFDASAENQLERLERIETASWVTLGILATIASGGTAGTAATTLLGRTMTVAQYGRALSIGAPIAAQSLAVVLKLATDQPIDPGRIGLDMFLAAVAIRFGPRLADGAFKLLGGRPEMVGVTLHAFRQMVANLLSHEAMTLFRGVADEVYSSARTGKVTWEAAYGRIEAKMLDPVGLFIALVFAALGAGVAMRTARGREELPERPKIPPPLPPSEPSAPAEPTLLYDPYGVPSLYQQGSRVRPGGVLEIYNADGHRRLLSGRRLIDRAAPFGGLPPRPVPIHVEPVGAPLLVSTPAQAPQEIVQPIGPSPVFLRPRGRASFLGQGGEVVEPPRALRLSLGSGRPTLIAPGGTAVPEPQAPTPLYDAHGRGGLYLGGARLPGGYEPPRTPDSRPARDAVLVALKNPTGSGRLTAEANDRVARLVATAEVRIRAHPAAIGEILRTGRLKTQFETGTSNGILSGNSRSATESALFGTQHDAPATRRPVYGYLSGSDEETLGQYGAAVIRLKPAVRSRSTFTLGDSLDETVHGMVPRIAAEPLTQPSALAGSEPNAQVAALDRLRATSSRRDVYAEAQVHGGVSLSDIAEIVFTDNFIPDPGLRARLRAAGVAWRVIDGSEP